MPRSSASKATKHLSGDSSARNNEFGSFYAFSMHSPRRVRRNALVVAFCVAILFFAVFAASKIPFVVFQAGVKGEPVEFSANLAALGWSTGVEVTTSWWAFVLPHIVVAVLLEVLFVLIMLRYVRLSTRWVREGVFVLTLVHCALIWPNWRGLPGPAGNVLFTAISVLAALELRFVDGRSQLGFSWLVLAINSGPVGEVGFWLVKLREGFLEWREAGASSPSPHYVGDVVVVAPTPSPGSGSEPGSASVWYGVLLAVGILACALLLMAYFLIAAYNIWFFTWKHGALPGSLWSYYRGT